MVIRLTDGLEQEVPFAALEFGDWFEWIGDGSLWMKCAAGGWNAVGLETGVCIKLSSNFMVRPLKRTMDAG